MNIVWLLYLGYLYLILRYLGIDYGKKNIGVAFGVDDLAQPLMVVDGKNWDVAIGRVIKIALENKVEKIIIGLPLSGEGKRMQIAFEVERFGKLLESKAKLKVEFFDETATTKEALMGSIEYGLSQKARRKLDAVAAAIMLQHYVESRKE